MLVFCFVWFGLQAVDLRQRKPYLLAAEQADRFPRPIFMAKKNILQSDFDEDDAILSRKAKRRLVREAEKAANSSQGQPKTSKQEEVVEDKMSQVARLCQNGQWREAAHLCLTTLASEEIGRAHV